MSVTRLPPGNRATVQPLPDDLPNDLPGDLFDELDAFLMQASHDEIDPVTRRISDCQLYTLVASEPYIRRDRADRPRNLAIALRTVRPVVRVQAPRKSCEVPAEPPLPTA